MRSGIAAFTFLHGRWMWVPPGSACYTLHGSGHGTMHTAGLLEILETA